MNADLMPLGAFVEDGIFRFRVWAPAAKSVELVLESGSLAPRRWPMRREDGGYFSTALEGVRAGDLYRYRLDGRGPFPDPASRYQPQGVHGPSMVVDPAAFGWTDDGWRGCPLEQMIFYELHVGTFTPEGSFLGALGKLDTLKELGINTLELMPVFDFAGRWNWGYDGAALFAPAHVYGTPDELRRLVDGAHRREMSVIADVVYNHIGPDGSVLFEFSSDYLTKRHKNAWGDGINFDGDASPEVRDFFVQNALVLVRDYHLDGLRLDATDWIIDDTKPHILAELKQCVRQRVNRRVLFVAEDPRPNLPLDPPEQGGYGLDAVWGDTFHHQLRRFMTGDHEGYFAPLGGTMAEIAAVVESAALERNPEYALHRYISCIQNHDQIGNRPQGDRLNHKVAPEVFRCASAVLLLAPETPLIFMGQEWGASTPFLYFTDHHAELGQNVTEGRRDEFKAFSAYSNASMREHIPDPQAESTFQASRLRWDEREEPPHRATLRFYKALIELRRDQPALRVSWGREVRAMALGDNLLSLRRSAEGEELLLLACLRGSAQLDLGTLEPKVLSSNWVDLLDSNELPFGGSEEQAVRRQGPRLEFPCPGALVLKRRL